MQELVIEIIEKFGYLGITLLIAIENIFPPIPSEVILTFGGFATSFTSLNVVGVIIASTIGAVIGAIVLYYVGRILNEERLEKIVQGKIGKILRLKISDIKMAFGWFEKRGKLTVFFCRCIPIVRSLISIPAGMTKMSFVPFLFFTTLGSLIWNTILTVLGAVTGNSWTKIVGYFDSFSKITLIVLVLIFVACVYLFYRNKKKSKK